MDAPSPALLAIVPLLPLCAGVVLAFLPYSARGLAFGLAVAALGGSTLTSLFLLGGVIAHPEAASYDFTWMTLGGTPLQLGLLLNPLTAIMIAAVTFVSTFIFIYSHGYMHEDRRYVRFFCFLSLFSAGMLGLCVANSLVLLFISWEIVGLCSYLLIGFWYMKPSAAAAAKKAFIVTKIGDAGFFLGIVGLWSKTGTQLLVDHGHGLLESATLAPLAGGTAAVLALLVFCGAVGKSGQFPLHIWLPDAMEGPTPVSALIHAATMVAAGVFLVARMHPLFAAGPVSLDVVTWIGGFTALLAATIAVAQNDIKRILAYSTVSQLGFMMLGLGAVGVVAGIFHLVTHAFFKALLFLGAGSVIHGCHEEQDIRKMGGLRTSMKVTFLTYVVGAAALAGVFPLAGFWSKDDILLGALHAGTERGAIVMVPFAMGMTAAFLTSFYMTRQVAMVFFGKQRSHDYHPHESPTVMTLPLVVLAVFAFGIGLLGTPWANWFHHFLAPQHLDTLNSPRSALHAPHASIPFMLVATAISFAGIGAGWMMYGKAPATDPLERIQPLHAWLARRWYFDELYDVTIVRLVGALAFLSTIVDLIFDAVTIAVARIAKAGSWVVHFCDEYVVRAIARTIAAIVRGVGRLLSHLQSGRVQGYLSAIALAAVVLVLLSVVMRFGR